MHKNCSFIRNRTSERGELTQRTNEPVRFLIQKQLVHKCSTNHLPCGMAFILYILRIRIILPEFYFKSFLFTSEKHRSLLWLARTHLCTKIFWHGFLTSISQYVFNKKTCIQCRENFLGLYIDNRERPRFPFTPNGRSEFVPRDQVFPYFPFTLYCFYTKIRFLILF